MKTNSCYMSLDLDRVVITIDDTAKKDTGIVVVRITNSDEDFNINLYTNEVVIT